MKKNLKWAALLLALTTMVTMVACSGGGESEETKNAQAEITKIEDIQTEMIEAEHETEGSKGLDFTSNGDGTCSVSGIGKCSDTDIVIPTKSPEGDIVTSVDQGAFFRCAHLTSITIPDSVTSIGASAFQNCSSLIKIENGVSYVDRWVVGCENNVDSVILKSNTIGISDNAFYGCLDLNNIVLPEGVMSIGSNAFSYCPNLTNIEIPHSVKSIGKSAFDNNLQQNENGVYYVDNWVVDCRQSETSVTLRSNTVGIANQAFSACSYLKSIQIPDSVKNIGGAAFSSCGALESIEIPHGVTSISDAIFFDCRNLTTIKIPVSVTSIGGDAFSYCGSLTSITFTGTKAQWLSIEKKKKFIQNEIWPESGTYTVHCTDGDIPKSES